MTSGSLLNLSVEQRQIQQVRRQQDRLIALPGASTWGGELFFKQPAMMVVLSISLFSVLQSLLSESDQSF